MRRFVCLGLASLACVVSACGQDTATFNAAPAESLWTREGGHDWSKFLGPTSDSKSTEKGILTAWPKEGPKIVWQRKLGIGYAPPTISRGRLYMFSRFNDRFEGGRQVGDARLTCMNAETGKELWKFEYKTDYEDRFGYNGGPRCCPVVDGDRLYLYGAAGMLRCLNALTGKPIWKVDTFAKFNVQQNFFGVGAAPLVEGDLLITVVGGSPPDQEPVGLALDEVKPGGSGVVAFDKRTGEVKYKITDELAGYASPVAATVGGRRWCFVFARGGLIGFEPKSGKVDFHFPWRAKSIECVNAANPIVVGDRVFISETYGPGSALLQFKPGGYETVWTDLKRGRKKAMLAHWNTPIHHAGYVYGCSGRHTAGSDLRCIELATGKVMWKVEGDEAEDAYPFGRSSLMYVDGHFICLTEFGELILLKANPKKYEPLARILLRDKGGKAIPGFGAPPLLEYPAWAAPVLTHGLLYVRGKDRLVCLELRPKQ